MVQVDAGGEDSPEVFGAAEGVGCWRLRMRIQALQAAAEAREEGHWAGI